MQRFLWNLGKSIGFWAWDLWIRDSSRLDKYVWRIIYAKTLSKPSSVDWNNYEYSWRILNINHASLTCIYTNQQSVDIVVPFAHLKIQILLPLKKFIARQKTFVLSFSHPFIHLLPHNISTEKLFKTTKVHINSPSFCPRQQCCEIANNPVIMRTVTVLLMLSNILGSVPIQHSQWSNYSKSTNLLLDLIGNYLWAIMSLNGAANCQRFLRSFRLITDKKLNESLTARLFPLAILSKYFFILTTALPRGRYQTNFSLIYYSNCDLNWIYFLIGTFSLLSSHWTAAISRGPLFQLHLRILIFQKKTLLRSLDVHLLPSLDNKEVSLANFIIHSESRRKKSFN